MDGSFLDPPLDLHFHSVQLSSQDPENPPIARRLRRQLHHFQLEQSLFAQLQVLSMVLTARSAARKTSVPATGRRGCGMATPDELRYVLHMTCIRTMLIKSLKIPVQVRHNNSNDPPRPRRIRATRPTRTAHCRLPLLPRRPHWHICRRPLPDGEAARGPRRRLRLLPILAVHAPPRPRSRRRRRASQTCLLLAAAPVLPRRQIRH